jgi:hypothetical protein
MCLEVLRSVYCGEDCFAVDQDGGEADLAGPSAYWAAHDGLPMVKDAATIGVGVVETSSEATLLQLEAEDGLLKNDQDLILVLIFFNNFV